MAVFIDNSGRPTGAFPKVVNGPNNESGEHESGKLESRNEARAWEKDREGLRLETRVASRLLCLAREPRDVAVPDFLISRCRSTCIWIGARSGQEMFRRETAVVFVTRTS